MEEWRDIAGFEGLYMVSNTGRVKSLDKYVKTGINGIRLIEGQEIKLNKYPNGYLTVNLIKDRKAHSQLVHRLVAKAFIPNPDNLPQVNHKDEDITNNNVDNLEWCTPKYNANYGTRNARCYESKRYTYKPVYQIDKDCGMIIRWWESIASASKALNIDDALISRVCKRKGNYAGGFVWRYADEYDKKAV